MKRILFLIGFVALSISSKALDISILITQYYAENSAYIAVSYTHLRAHETVLDIVCRLLLEKKKT